MKIGIDARMISATGIGRYTQNLIESLAILDKENEYLVFLKSEDSKKIKLPDNFKKVPADFHWYGLAEQIKFPRLIKQNKIDLMHFPHFNVPVFYRGKFVVTIHDLTLSRYKTVKATTKSFLTYQIKHFFYKLIIFLAIKRAKKIISPSLFTKEEIINSFKINEDKVIVTLEGGPSLNMLKIKESYNSAFKIKESEGFILYVGNAYPHKNLELLVESLKDVDKDILLVLAGKEDDFYKNLKNRVKRLKMDDRVIFTGFVSDEELTWLYKNALAYAFPSLNEGFGLPLLEAASFGLPVVCSKISSLPEVMGDSALYFDPYSKEDMAKKINLIVGDNNLREKLIKKGLERIKLFSWQKMAKETLPVYNSLLNKKF